MKKRILLFAMLSFVIGLLMCSTAFSAPVYPSFDELMIPQTGCIVSCGDSDIELFSADDEAQKPLTHQKLLTILIDLNDIKITMGSEFWNKEMFDTTPEKLSVANYWKENSNGLDIFEPADTSGVEVGRKGTVSYEDYTDVDYEIIERADGVVRVSLDIPHPTPTGDWNVQGLSNAAHLAFKAIEADFDFAAEQPHIVTIFAGYVGKGHFRAFTSLSGIETSEGINLGPVTVQPEMLYVGVPEGIGTICHELGHSVFKLPDLYFEKTAGYDNEYTLMSAGSNGRRYDPADWDKLYDDPYAQYGGHVPTHLDPWCKIQCGFVTPELVVSDWDGDVNSISDMGTDSTYNVLKVMSKADPKQYFLVENRQLIGFDKGLEIINTNANNPFNGGIMIWHIDDNIVEKSNNNEAKMHRAICVERSNSEDTTASDPHLWAYLNKDGRNILNTETAPNSNFHQPKARTEICSQYEDCHPQTVKSGISIEVLDESSPSMRVKVSVDDKYKINTGETFSDVFPDINFCNAIINILKQEDSIERNPNDVISTEDWLKLISTERLSVNNCNIEDLTGIERFPKLKTFNCSGNKLTQLKLSEYPLLRNLTCGGNELTALDVSRCKNLWILYCNDNKLTELDVSSNQNLRYLYCHNNLLSELDLSDNIALSYLHCYGNQLTYLNLENNVWLRILHCYDNYMNENYKLSIEESETFDTVFNSGQSSNFKYLPQKTLGETPSPTPTATPTPSQSPTPSPTPSSTPTPSPSPTPTATPTPSQSPTPSPSPSPTPTPSPSVTPTSTPKTGDRVEFERTGDKVTARLIFEETASPAENDIMLIIAYKENGALKRAEMPTITDMTASFVIPEKYKDCEITVYVWDKNMKPLMSAQSVH